MVMNMKILRFATALSVITLLMAACSPVKTVTPLAPDISPTDETAPGNATQPSPPASAPTQSSGGQNQPPGNGTISLQVLAPLDGTVVNASQIEVSGLASVGAVVTVNDNILIVGADGQFSTVILLDEGPNLIEVIASNELGSELSVELTVTYQP